MKANTKVSHTKFSFSRVTHLVKPYTTTLAIVLLLIIIGGIFGTISPFLIQKIVDDALPASDMDLLYKLVLGLAAISIFTTIVSVVQSYISTSIGQKIMHDLRVKLYEHLQSLSLSFFSSTRTGEIQARITSDISKMQSLLTNTATDFARHITAIITTTIAMLLLDWRIAIVSILIVPLLVLVNQRVAKIRERIMHDQQERVADLSSNITESLSAGGFILARTMGRAKHLVHMFRKNSEDLSKLETRSNTAGQWEFAIIFLFLDMLPAFTFFGGGMLLGMGYQVSIGTMVAFVALQEQLLWPLLEVFETRIEFGKVRAILTRVFSYLDMPPEITERENPLTLDKSEFKKGITFENVSFSYDRESVSLLKNISFTIPAGKYTALIGPTGSGKSTIGNLIARLYDTDEGRILFDGIDVKDLSFKSISELLGIVTQDPFLLNASIEENLLFAKPDATGEEIANILQVAQLKTLIASLPEGLQTQVGERGYQFSGGERQRLCIARTLLRQPPILLLDEATSALDAETQKAFTAALSSVSDGMTVISIAHRLSTVRYADQIIVLENGRVEEIGTHDHLITLGGRYAKMIFN
ncbi:uncharacterized protein CHSO_3328 [Chryseobacterium sp. StRB126]|uniref:ABC transporter ATP-binding protein n=1 Tax=Chryseobacterium sp. StRB126 TaxID=878220 RepID=UPI0004E99A71|nr:ABC transporter ATP-binding protein [Chryseobacterium sp. StRB126]BAP32365.1 uncharacterized protein CHSO_3328 [Chryseobacterium sp. StRB126]